MSSVTNHIDAPEVSDELSALAELKGLGDLIRSWQESQSPTLSNQGICNRYPQLGTTRSYKRVYSGDGIDGLNLEDWLPKYRSVWEQIQTDAIDATEEPVYDDLGPAIEVRTAWVQLMSQHGLQRWVNITGDTGSGKSSALKALKEKIGGNAYLVEAHEGWNRFRTAIQLFAKGLGITPSESETTLQSAGDWLELIIKRLNARGRRVILIDEAHHFTGEMLNALKAMITRTDCVFITAGMDTLWGKLTAASSQEARQLKFNRMLKQITLTAPSLKDTKSFLERRAGAEGSDQVLKKLIDASRTRGGFAFLRRVAIQLNRRTAGTVLGDEEIIEAVAEAREALGE